MKKLGIFALLGCLLTVGGVYAQWVYGQASAGSVSESIIPQMAGVGESSKKGTIGLVTTGLTMVIDEDPTNQYMPVLQIEGSVSITFTPNAGADQDVKDNGIKMAWTLTQSANWNYDPLFGGNATDPIFTLTGCTDIAINGGNPTKNPVVITAEQIANCLVFCEGKAVYLPTYEENVRFDNAMSQYKITITITEIA